MAVPVPLGPALAVRPTPLSGAVRHPLSAADTSERRNAADPSGVAYAAPPVAIAPPLSGPRGASVGAAVARTCALSGAGVVPYDPRGRDPVDVGAGACVLLPESIGLSVLLCSLCGGASKRGPEA